MAVIKLAVTETRRRGKGYERGERGREKGRRETDGVCGGGGGGRGRKGEEIEKN